MLSPSENKPTTREPSLNLKSIKNATAAELEEYLHNPVINLHYLDNLKNRYIALELEFEKEQEPQEKDTIRLERIKSRLDDVSSCMTQQAKRNSVNTDESSTIDITEWDNHFPTDVLAIILSKISILKLVPLRAVSKEFFKIIDSMRIYEKFIIIGDAALSTDSFDEQYHASRFSLNELRQSQNSSDQPLLKIAEASGLKVDNGEIRYSYGKKNVQRNAFAWILIATSAALITFSAYATQDTPKYINATDTHPRMSPVSNGLFMAAVIASLLGFLYGALRLMDLNREEREQKLERSLDFFANKEIENEPWFNFKRIESIINQIFSRSSDNAEIDRVNLILSGREENPDEIVSIFDDDTIENDAEKSGNTHAFGFFSDSDSNSDSHPTENIKKIVVSDSDDSSSEYEERIAMESPQ